MSSVHLPFKQYLFPLKDSFHSIDIRSAAYNLQSEWRSLLTGIRISARSEEEVKKKHLELEGKFGTKHVEPFRVFFQSYPLTELDSILQELTQEGSLLLEGKKILFDKKPNFDQVQVTVNRFQNLIRPWYEEDWPGVYYPHGDRPRYFNQPDLIAAIRKSGWGSTEEAVSFCLELNKQELYARGLELFLYIEMPARINLVGSVGQRLEFKVKAEKNLRHLKFYLKTGNLDGPPRRLKLEKTGEDGNFVLLRAEAEDISAKENDGFSCVLTHESVPELDELSGRLKNFRLLSERNPLLECLKQFWDIEKFYRQIEQPHKTEPKKITDRAQDTFQKSVVVLLNLAGFQAIDLGRNDVIRDPNTNVVRATLDILAYYSPSKVLLLGECVLNNPKTDDFTKLLNAKEVLSKLFPADSTIKLIPVLFTSQEGDALSSGEVIVFNAKRLAKLRQLIEKGSEDLFLSSLEWPAPFNFGFEE